MTEEEMVVILKHQQIIIDRLSRKIQKLKKEIKSLKIKRTLFGNNVILIPADIQYKILSSLEKELINGISTSEPKGIVEAIKKGW